MWDMTHIWHAYVWHDSFTRMTCALPSYVYLYTYIVQLIPSACLFETWHIYDIHTCEWFIFIYSYIRIHIHIHIHIFIYSYIHMFIHSYIHIFIYSYIHIFIYSYVHMFIYSYIHIFIYSYVHIFIYSYIICSYVHIHIDICIYSYAWTWVSHGTCMNELYTLYHVVMWVRGT